MPDLLACCLSRSRQVSVKRPDVSFFRNHFDRAIARMRPVAAELLRRLRHPTRRGLVRAAAAVPALVLLYVLVLIPFTPGIGDIRKAKVDEPARIFSADGKLLAEFRPVNREWAKLADISPNVVEALVATEDHRFYQHHGLDWRRTASAAVHTFSGDRQGGSTITQQLARNLYPDDIGRSRSRWSTRKPRSSKPISIPCRSCTTRTASRWRRAPTSTNPPIVST
jgi:penicillin-binding protein 1A